MHPFLTPRNYLLVLATALVCAISYYFLVSLPAHNAALVQLERLKFEAEEKRKAAEQRAKEEKELAEARARESAQINTTAKENLLNICTLGANEVYWSFVKVNGKKDPFKPDTYTAPGWVFEEAAKRKKVELDECYRKYRQ